MAPIALCREVLIWFYSLSSYLFIDAEVLKWPKQDMDLNWILDSFMQLKCSGLGLTSNIIRKVTG